MSTHKFNLDSIDTQCFIDWDIDLLKVDNCNRGHPLNLRQEQSMMAKWRSLLPSNVILYNSRYGCMAKPNCHRKNVYGCRLGKYQRNYIVPQYCDQYCNMFRITRDIEFSWSYILDQVQARIGKSQQSKPGSWADLDSLLPDSKVFTYQQQRSQFSMWCILSSNLLISQDLTTLDSLQIAMLSNPIALQVNQQYFGDSGDLSFQHGDLYVFTKVLKGEIAVLLVNFNEYSTVKWVVTNLGIIVKLCPNVTSCNAYNIWENTNTMLQIGQIVSIPPADSIFLTLSKCT